MRHKITVLTFVVGLMSLGCAEERPTGTTRIPELSTISISAPLLADSSERVEGYLESDSTYSITLGNTDLFATSTFDDIHLTFAVCHGGFRDVIAVYDYFAESWTQCVVSVLRCGGGLGPACRDGSRFISQVPGDIATSRLDSQGRLSLLLPSAVQDVRAQLIRYSPGYQFATLLSDRACNSQLWFANGALYALADDTLMSHDREGRRRWAVAIDGGSSRAAFDGEYIWSHAPIPLNNHLLQIDTLGNVVASIVSNQTFVDGMAWLDGRLWYIVNDRFIEIDLDSTLSLGEVVTRAFITADFPGGLLLSVTADSIGPIAAIAKPSTTLSELEPWVYRYRLDGALRDSFKCAASIEAIAWDGETLWALHHGPQEAKTDATLLARFTLE